jgi:F-type H+-transporting ATPase subunit gamma
MMKQEVAASVVTVGRKGRDFMARTGRDLRASFMDMGDRPSLADTLPITRLVERAFMEGETDEVHLAYTRYVNTLVQEPVVTQLLPVNTGDLAETAVSTGYLYEPNPLVVLGALLPRFLEVQVFQAFLESNASEQSARMVAMRNATEAADDMIEGLTLELNKARQNMITAELLDLVGGVAALEG